MPSAERRPQGGSERPIFEALEAVRRQAEFFVGTAAASSSTDLTSALASDAASDGDTLALALRTLECARTVGASPAATARTPHSVPTTPARRPAQLESAHHQAQGALHRARGRVRQVALAVRRRLFLAAEAIEKAGRASRCACADRTGGGGRGGRGGGGRHGPRRDPQCGPLPTRAHCGCTVLSALCGLARGRTVARAQASSYKFLNCAIFCVRGLDSCQDDARVLV